MFSQAYGNTRLARLLATAALHSSGVVLLMALFTMCSQTADLLWLVLLMLVADVTVLGYGAKQGLLFQLLLEQKWKKTCVGIGGKFVSQKTRPIANPFWVFGGSLMRERTQIKVPKLREVHGNRESFTATIHPFYGQTVEEYTKNEGAFSLCFNTPYIAFEKTNTGLIKMRCGPVQVPDMYTYPVERLAEPVPTTADVAAVLKAVPMAVDIEGNPWSMPIEENHILIAGRTGSGKNSVTWSLVFGLAQARKAGIVRLWGLDPKKVELAFGRECWDEYADTIEGMVDLLEKAVNDLLERNTLIQGKARKIQPSREQPLNVIIIDELAYLSALVPDKKQRDRAQAAIGTILLLGRATGYCLVACTQDVRKEVISFRDYFVTRIALGMPAPMVDLCLGEGAWEAGAKAEQIPLRAAGAGSAYVLDEVNNKPLLVRAAWCSDEAIRMMLADPQAFGVESDDSLRQYQQGYAGVDTSAQGGFNGWSLEAGQSAPQQLHWEDLPPEQHYRAYEQAYLPQINCGDEQAPQQRQPWQV